MKVHISFDAHNFDQAIAIAPHVASYADSISIGQNLLYQKGINVIDTFKKACPTSIIVADTKILDLGKTTVSLLEPYQPHWITVMAGASQRTIHATCSTAHTARIKVMMNLLDATSVGQSAMEAEGLGVDALIYHQSYDEEDPLAFIDKWDMVKENTKLPVFISTKIDRSCINELIALQPDGIIIGNAITQSKKPEAEAQFFFELCNKQR